MWRCPPKKANSFPVGRLRSTLGTTIEASYYSQKVLSLLLLRLPSRKAINIKSSKKNRVLICIPIFCAEEMTKNVL